jgi:membrane protein DedA with SNARE-associated domain
MMVAAGCGAVVGDSIGYEIGRHFGGRLRDSRLGRRVGAERWAKADAHLADHGGRAVFLGRFIGFLRALVPALAGASGMPYRKFIAYNALGGLLWAPGLVLAGYAAGSSYSRVERYAGRAGLMLAVVVLVVVAIVVAARSIARHPAEIQAFVGRWLDRPLVRRRRYRRQIDFVIRRLRPGQALGLALTLQLAVLGLFRSCSTTSSSPSSADPIRRWATSWRRPRDSPSPRAMPPRPRPSSAPWPTSGLCRRRGGGPRS